MFGERRQPLNPDEIKAKKKAENDAQDALYAEMLAEYEQQATSPEVRKEAGPEVLKFNELIAEFEQEYSLEELHNIVDLTPSEAAVHPLREPARKALVAIVSQLKILKKEVDISTDALTELELDYKRVSQAVGIINNDKVDHTR